MNYYNKYLKYKKKYLIFKNQYSGSDTQKTEQLYELYNEMIKLVEILYTIEEKIIELNTRIRRQISHMEQKNKTICLLINIFNFKKKYNRFLEELIDENTRDIKIDIDINKFYVRIQNIINFIRNNFKENYTVIFDFKNKIKNIPTHNNIIEIDEIINLIPEEYRIIIITTFLCTDKNFLKWLNSKEYINLEEYLNSLNFQDYLNQVALNK